jgi:hypothetical protein
LGFAIQRVTGSYLAFRCPSRSAFASHWAFAMTTASCWGWASMFPRDFGSSRETASESATETEISFA